MKSSTPSKRSPPPRHKTGSFTTHSYSSLFSKTLSCRLKAISFMHAVLLFWMLKGSLWTSEPLSRCVAFSGIVHDPLMHADCVDAYIYWQQALVRRYECMHARYPYLLAVLSSAVDSFAGVCVRCEAQYVDYTRQVNPCLSCRVNGLEIIGWVCLELGVVEHCFAPCVLPCRSGNCPTQDPAEFTVWLACACVFSEHCSPPCFTITTGCHGTVLCL